ncbi:hypothetical protein [Pontibacter vulgaris]|uniref:hypothetical protein n=1 Tax=Pontibacter vulgaris TaxID=2905679 RepID=UPI001FA7CA34|nr:hypothetical protein [Pontibacter vulgaris]
MKRSFYLNLLCFCLSVVMFGCSENDPEPLCLQVEVVGADCENGWYLLHVLDENFIVQNTQDYTGPLQAGYVTTDNLPLEYQQAGRRLNVAMDTNGERSPRCVAVTVMYPAVTIKRVCDAVPTGER